MKRFRVWAMNFLVDCISGALYAIGIDTFAKMAGFAPGGLSGLALIVNHLWGLPIGLTVLVLNVPLMLISYRFLGFRFLKKTLGSMIVCTLFLDVVFVRVPPYTGNRLLAALYSGVFLGLALALLYRRGSSSGGTDFLTLSIKARHPHLSVGAVTMTIDVIIILLGWPVFGSVDAVLYGLIATAATSLVIDKALRGAGAGRLILVITAKGPLVARHINQACGRGSTMCPAVGCYTGEARQILFCACSRVEAYKIRTAVHHIDTEAFVMIADTNEVFGNGFADPSGSSFLP